MANPNGTALQIATDSDFSNLVLNETTDYATERTFAKGDLPYGKDLYARVRHSHPETGWSNWSNTLKFSLIVPANIIGVCMDYTKVVGARNGGFHWIDMNGNKLQKEFKFWEHPTYANIATVKKDASRDEVWLTRFPLFYVKTAVSGPAGTDSAGKKCWWISDVEEVGFRPAACFKRASVLDANGRYVISPYCYMGRYLGHASGKTINGQNVVGSAPYKTVLASQTKAQFKTRIEARNVSTGTDDQKGYRMFDIWDLGALRILLLIGRGDSDTQKYWGDNNTTNGTNDTADDYPITGVTNARAVFDYNHSPAKQTPFAQAQCLAFAEAHVSMEDLWRCYWYHADLISISSGVVTLVNPMDKVTNISFGSANATRYTQPTSSGWIVDVLDCPFVIGNHTHDLLELFLPKTVNGTENNGTFSDYHWIWNWGGILAGGEDTAAPSRTGRMCGLFISDPQLSIEYRNVSSRLSKD